MSVPAGSSPHGQPRTPSANTLTCPDPKAVPRRPDERDHRARLTADRNIRRGTIQALQSPPDQPAARADDLRDDPGWPQLPMAHRWNSARQGRGAAVSRTPGHRGDAALHLTPRPPALANQTETSTQDDARALQTPQVRAHDTVFGTPQAPTSCSVAPRASMCAANKGSNSKRSGSRGTDRISSLEPSIADRSYGGRSGVVAGISGATCPRRRCSSPFLLQDYGGC